MICRRSSTIPDLARVTLFCAGRARVHARLGELIASGKIAASQVQRCYGGLMSEIAPPNDVGTYDPEHRYYNRITRVIFPLDKPAREWRQAVLEKLLRDVESGR